MNMLDPEEKRGQKVNQDRPLPTSAGRTKKKKHPTESPTEALAKALMEALTKGPIKNPTKAKGGARKGKATTRKRLIQPQQLGIQFL
jgi:hypothetical protein